MPKGQSRTAKYLAGTKVPGTPIKVRRNRRPFISKVKVLLEILEIGITLTGLDVAVTLEIKNAVSHVLNLETLALFCSSAAVGITILFEQGQWYGLSL